MTNIVPTKNVNIRIATGSRSPQTASRITEEPRQQRRVRITERANTVDLQIPDNRYLMPFHWNKPTGPQIRVTQLTVTWTLKGGRRDVTYKIAGPRLLPDGSYGNDLVGSAHSQNPPAWLAGLVEPFVPDWYRS